MNRCIVVLTLLLAVCAGFVLAQDTQDVVYLKNGSIIRGMIVEQIPGKSIKIQTRDGSVFVYPMEDIERMTREAQAEQAGGPATNKFAVGGHVGTDITGGLGFGGGLAYILAPGGASYGHEFAVDYFFHEYDESGSGESEYTDLSIIAFRANWLWNYNPGQSGVYFITGVGFVYAMLDYTIEYSAATYGQFSSETYDYTSVGNAINLGIGWTSASGIGARLETPMIFFYSSGSASSFVPTFTLAVKFIF